MISCWVYFLASLLHFVSILLLLHFQEEIVNETIFVKEQSISNYSDIERKWMIVCIVINGSILLFFKLKAQCITSQQMITLVMIIIAIIGYLNGIIRISLNINSYYIIFILFPSIITCRLWINYEQIKIDNKMFEYDGNKDMDWNERKNHIIFYKLLTLLYNIIMNIYCFVLTDKPFNIAYISAFTILGTVGIIPYYLLPSVKYDVFHKKSEIVYTYFIVSTLMLSQLAGLLIFKRFQHPVFSIINDLCFNLCILFMFFTETLDTVYLPYIKKQKFISICNSKQEPLLWSDYIVRNINNYNQFTQFLLDDFCVTNLLFIIDIMQYKNTMIQIINNSNIDYGYILQFNSGGNILPTSPIVDDLQIIYNETDLEIIMDNIYNDIIAFYYKYIALNSRSIKAKFISQKQLMIIRQKIQNGLISDDHHCMNTIRNMLIIFDKALVELNGFLQILYTEYQLKSDQ